MSVFVSVKLKTETDRGCVFGLKIEKKFERLIAVLFMSAILSVSAGIQTQVG